MNEAELIEDWHAPIELSSQIADLAEIAKAYHTDEADFHHFPHSWQVYLDSMRIADMFESNGNLVDRRILAFAAILHDTRAHEPLSEAEQFILGLESIEDRSAAIGYFKLLELGYDEQTVAEPVSYLIGTTNRTVQLTTIESVILRMADVFNTNENFEIFEDRALAMYQESVRFKGCQKTFEAWLPGAMDYLRGFYTDPQIPDWFKVEADIKVERILAKYPVVA